MKAKFVNYLILLGIFCWGFGVHLPISAWASRVPVNEKISLVQAASFSLVDGLQRVQQHFAGKAKFANISRRQDQLVYKIGVVVDNQLKIVFFDPHTGKIMHVDSAKKFWHWKRYFTDEEQKQFLQTPTDLLKAIQVVQRQQEGTVIRAHFKLEEGVHFYRVVLWVHHEKQIWIVDSDTEVAFLAKKNYEGER